MRNWRDYNGEPADWYYDWRDERDACEERLADGDYGADGGDEDEEDEE